MVLNSESDADTAPKDGAHVMTHAGVCGNSEIQLSLEAQTFKDHSYFRQVKHCGGTWCNRGFDARWH